MLSPENIYLHYII